MENSVTLLRRLGAMIYDTVLAGFSIVIVASIPFLLFSKATGVELPDPLKVLVYLLMAWGFFMWFWTHGGQTLGMRAWKIRIVSDAGQPINRQQATQRFLWAILSWGALGVGFLVSLIDPEKLAWHDRFSRTRLIRIR
ncbi:RDD family protein [Thiothrix nivea]|uniref:RDD domain containing protein n=1 Tax=Thiothrix nivea (strain ATCC 35100 / DSM 5205 / JP2) TaxID=870187 RepID=A0A656HJM0_THINJ|nr:RDD family protein [Thiothrix nivea]EIJ36412.1 RDD domain containing protein [Thiothrix nivea DSM 5205]